MKRITLLALIVALLVMVLATATTFAAPAEGGYACKSVHVVKRGQTLSGISYRYGVSVHKVAQANNIRNYNKVYVGQRLCIPGAKNYYQPAQPKPPAAGACKYHVVKNGQSLQGIAVRYGTSTWKIAQLNNISNPNYIYPGQTLVIRCKSAPVYPVQPVHPAKPPHHPAQPSHPGHPPAHPPEGYYPPPSQPGDGYSSHCSIQPVHGFGKVWFHNPEVQQKLGCPTEVEHGFNATEQYFKNAYVVQDNDAKQIYVIYANGLWMKYPDTWNDGDPINNPALVPPYGYYQPQYGIGKMWRNEDNFSQRMGWAKYHQQPVTATKQQFERGEMLWTATRGIFVLYDTWSWRHFN